jgi:WXXGXW repeat (2 copies)
MRLIRLTRTLLPLLLASFTLTLPAPVQAQVGVSVSVAIAPPPLPVYVEPPLPAEGYIFIPGYWAWGPQGYYWVPGTWVEPPAPGLLWTPGWWQFVNGRYLWHAGYWGLDVGFYGGINYGFGYFGTGYEGGYWDHDRFYYNRAVHNFGSVHVTHVYRRTVAYDRNRRASFAGPHGSAARPHPEDETAAREKHWEPSAAQMQHEHMAAGHHPDLASVNHGRPPVVATQRPATFTGRGVVAAGSPASPRPKPATGHAPGHGPGGGPGGHGPESGPGDHGGPERH